MMSNRKTQLARVPQNITFFLFFNQSENHPKIGAPTAKPTKIRETACEEIVLENPYAYSIKETPHNPPKTMTGAKAKPL